MINIYIDRLEDDDYKKQKKKNTRVRSSFDSLNDPIKATFRSSTLRMHSAKMHFAENRTFGKILKLFLRSDYAKRNYVC